MTTRPADALALFRQGRLLTPQEQVQVAEWALALERVMICEGVGADFTNLCDSCEPIYEQVGKAKEPKP